jgi:hypothetical protein
MSLEDKIQGLTDAVRALTKALEPTIITQVVEDPAPAKAEVVPPKPKATPTPSTAGLTASTTNEPPETTSTPATTAGIEYAQVAKAITDTFKVDRVKTIETLAKFGATKGPQLKPEDYAAFLKELTA